MKSSFALAVVAVVGLVSAPASYAWGGAGHEIVATIAQIYLHPTTLSNVCDILYPESSSTTSPTSPPCHLSRIASWADTVRRQPKYRYTGVLHYVGAVDDHPSENCAFPGSRGWNGKRDQNVLGAIRNTTSILVDYTDGMYGRETAEEALKFLVHYVGDMHMPLHLTGRERGGNGARVTFDGRVTNLHSLWDSLLIAQALRTIPYNYTAPFPPGTTKVEVEPHLRGAIYDPYVRRLMYEGMGVGVVDGRFESESYDWILCPAPIASEKPSLWTSLQTVLGMRAVDDETRWDDDVLCPYAWGRELHKLNCDFPIWPAELDLPPYNQSRLLQLSPHDPDHEDPVDFFSRPRTPHPDLLELDTSRYGGRIRSEWLVERLMAMAGVRLAGLLNGLFMDATAAESDCAPLPLILV